MYHFRNISRLVSVFLFSLLMSWAVWLALDVSAQNEGQSALTSANTITIRIAPEMLDQLPQAAIVSRIDYGSYVQVTLAASVEEQLGHFDRLIIPPLTLGNQPVGDPIPSAWQAAPSNTADFQLLQLIGPAKDEWLAAMTASGLQPVQYIYPNSYVVWNSDANNAKAATLDFVQWSAPFHPAYRVLPAYRSPVDAVESRVVIYRGADVAMILAVLAGIGGGEVVSAELNQTWIVAQTTLDATDTLAVAHLPGVFSVQPRPTDGGLRGELSNQIAAENLDGSGLAVVGYQAWLNSLGLSGAGVNMANVDGGFQQNHPDLLGRALPCGGSSCGGNANSKHGTHTAAIMAGSGSSGNVDSAGFLRSLGVAPAARLVEQVYFPTYTESGGMLTLMRQSSENGATISGNSWGPSGTPRGYDNDTMQVDIGVRDAQQSVAGNQALIYVLSFMNGNGGTSSQGSPDEAKNSITVGSTNAQTSSGTQSADIDNISWNSAHGPALDGRTIPTMVAPGCDVESAIWSSGYELLCGTSMASPHVAGAVALFVEQYQAQNGVYPSAALVKAALTLSARDLSGNLDADGNLLDTRYDSRQGWGRLNLSALLAPATDILYYDDPQLLTDSGDEWTSHLFVPDSAEPVRLMLTWTDAPGHGLGGGTPAWNNNLDLIVEAGGVIYYGNNFDANGWSMAAGTADLSNNTEAVFLPAGVGDIHITVRGTNVASDGVPGVGDGSDQDFALVCDNCTTSPASLQMTASADPISATRGETVTFTFTRRVAYTAPFTYAETITNVIPSALELVSGTLAINGVPLSPTLYNTATHTIMGSWVVTNVVSAETLTLTYQVVVADDAPLNANLTNNFYSDIVFNAGGDAISGSAGISFNVSYGAVEPVVWLPIVHQPAVTKQGAP